MKIKEICHTEKFKPTSTEINKQDKLMQQVHFAILETLDGWKCYHCRKRLNGVVKKPNIITMKNIVDGGK